MAFSVGGRGEESDTKHQLQGQSRFCWQIILQKKWKAQCWTSYCTYIRKTYFLFSCSHLELLFNLCCTHIFIYTSSESSKSYLTETNCIYPHTLYICIWTKPFTYVKIILKCKVYWFNGRHYIFLESMVVAVVHIALFNNGGRSCWRGYCTLRVGTQFLISSSCQYQRYPKTTLGAVYPVYPMYPVYPVYPGKV